METSPEYEGAGRIFLKAALWDLGIFSEENIKETDWDYYLTYSKGVNVVLENGKSFFIDLELPIERCIREVADGLINNVKPFIVHKVTDESLFKACMEGQMGFKMTSVSIVEQNDHVLSSFYNIMEFKRKYILKNRSFVVNKQKNILERSKSIFISQKIDKNEVVEYLFNLRGFDSISRQENTVNLVVDEGYAYKNILQEAMERLNGMYICDEQGRLVSIKF
jgi:hypothetical protein